MCDSDIIQRLLETNEKNAAFKRPKILGACFNLFAHGRWVFRIFNDDSCFDATRSQGRR